MSLRLNGSTSGYSEIDAPAIAGDQTFTLPGTGGTLDRLNRAGNVIQVVNYQTGAVATGTTTIPVDDTIPQNTEGTEFMTLAITPTNASNKLLIEVVCNVSNSAAAGQALAVALFQDLTANALATQSASTTGTAQAIPFKFAHYMTAGTTSSTTFKVRAGLNAAGTTTFNGTGGNRLYGGSYASSITITEIAA
jgi:hypothetical protein